MADYGQLFHRALNRMKHIRTLYAIGFRAITEHQAMAQGWNQQFAHIMDVGYRLSSCCSPGLCA
jgi:hypothetical protein